MIHMFIFSVYMNRYLIYFLLPSVGFCFRPRQNTYRNYNLILSCYLHVLSTLLHLVTIYKHITDILSLKKCYYVPNMLQQLPVYTSSTHGPSLALIQSHASVHFWSIFTAFCFILVSTTSREKHLSLLLLKRSLCFPASC